MLRKPATSKGQKGRQVSATYPWPAPVKGWFDAESIADMPAGSAYRLDNWFPESTSLKMRPGFSEFARLLSAGEIQVASEDTTLRATQAARIAQQRQVRRRSAVLSTTGFATRRGSGCVLGGDNGDSDGV